MWIIPILLLHYFLINPLEKLAVSKYYKSYRPICKIGPACLGMPSGHMEFYGIVTILLIYYKYIQYWVGILIMIGVVIHRIYYRMHTIPQLIAGGILAIIYSSIYIYTNLSFLSFCITLFVCLVLIGINKPTLNTIRRMFV